MRTDQARVILINNTMCSGLVHVVAGSRFNAGPFGRG